MNWRVDLALVIFVWRAAINPPGSLWRDAPFVLSAYFIAAVLVTRDRRVAFAVLTVAVMGLLFVGFAVRQVPLTMAALGLQP